MHPQRDLINAAIRAVMTNEQSLSGMKSMPADKSKAVSRKYEPPKIRSMRSGRNIGISQRGASKGRHILPKDPGPEYRSPRLGPPKPSPKPKMTNEQSPSVITNEASRQSQQKYGEANRAASVWSGIVNAKLHNKLKAGIITQDEFDAGIKSIDRKKTNTIRKDPKGHNVHAWSGRRFRVGTKAPPSTDPQAMAMRKDMERYERGGGKNWAGD